MLTERRYWGGKIHRITSGFLNGYSGQVVYVVTNGICVLTAYALSTTATLSTSVEILPGIPKSKITSCANVITQVYLSTDFANFYVNETGTTLMGRSQANKGFYATITYPIDDDYAEPAAYL